MSRHARLAPVTPGQIRMVAVTLSCVIAVLLITGGLMSRGCQSSAPSQSERTGTVRPHAVTSVERPHVITRGGIQVICDPELCPARRGI
jgi:hypothetical protein